MNKTFRTYLYALMAASFIAAIMIGTAFGAETYFEDKYKDYVVVYDRGCYPYGTGPIVGFNSTKEAVQGVLKQNEPEIPEVMHMNEKKEVLVLIYHNDKNDMKDVFAFGPSIMCAAVAQPDGSGV